MPKMNNIAKSFHLVMFIIIPYTCLQLATFNIFNLRIVPEERMTMALEKTPMKLLPLVLVFEGGCSGSTAVGRFIEEIIEAHGFERYKKVGFEFMDSRRKWKNPFYFELEDKMRAEKNATRDEILMETVKIAKSESQELNQPFYFKAHLPKVKHENRRKLEKIGVAYAGVYRENILDRCICTTKDCFVSAAGYPVYAHNGEKASICFDRRKKPDEKPVLTFFENPVNCLQSSLDKQEQIKNQDFPSVSEESLFEFEYTDDDEAWENSITAWMKILRPFLSSALDESVLTAVLKKYRNSRPLPKLHRELVYNFDDLKSEIKSTKWAKYLRE